MKVPIQDYMDMLKRYNEFVKKNKRNPNYVTYKDDKVLISYFLDSKKRYEQFVKLTGRKPRYVNVNTVKELQPKKGGKWTRRLERALKHEIRDMHTLFEAIRRMGIYKYYYNDVYPRNDAFSRIESRKGLNCADWCQVCYVVLRELGYKVDYVRGKFKCGGHIWLVVDGNIVFDPAHAAKNRGSARIGEWMCSGKPTDIVVNPKWLLVDDGKT